MKNRQRGGEKGRGVKGEGRFEKKAGPKIYRQIILGRRGSRAQTFWKKSKGWDLDYGDCVSGKTRAGGASGEEQEV